MGELSVEFSTAAKYLAIAVLGLLVLSPCIAIVWKGTNMRRGLWRAGCWRWVICCDRIYGERVSRNDLLERGHGAQTVEGYYQLMFAERERSSPVLRLATWRENLRHHGQPGLSTRLEQIRIKDELMKREEPLVLPQRVAPQASGPAKQLDADQSRGVPVSTSMQVVPAPVASIQATDQATPHDPRQLQEHENADAVV